MEPAGAPGAELGPANGHAPQILDGRSPRERGCRCGTRIRAGGTHLEVGGLSGDLDPLFRGRVFCSLGCVRAFFLETLSELEALDSRFAESQVTDLRSTYVQMAGVFSKLLTQFQSDWFKASGSPPK